MSDRKEKNAAESKEQELKDANKVMALGAGVGAAGVAAAVIIGVTCPLCYIVAPGLVVAGAIKRRSAKRKKTTT